MTMLKERSKARAVVGRTPRARYGAGRCVGLGAVVSLVAVVSVVAAMVPRAARAEDVNEILTRMRAAAEPGKDMKANVIFTITNERAENVKWTGKFYRRTGPPTTMRIAFEAPPDLKGTAVTIVRDPDGATKTRVYLPALRRVREISADTRGESFLGTDFNYEDLGFQQLEFQAHRLVDDAKCGDGGWHVESTPSRGWWYGRIDRCIDKKTWLPVRTEYYDKTNELWKVRTMGEVKKVGAYSVATQIRMETVPQHTSTTITFSDAAFDTGLADSVFQTP
jgi:outer membrane lipoprotein-sorting protein